MLSTVGIHWWDVLGVVGFGLGIVATIITAFQLLVARPQMKCFFHKLMLQDGMYLVGMIGNKPPPQLFTACRVV